MLHGHDETDGDETLSSGHSNLSANKVLNADPVLTESSFDKSLHEEDIDKSPFIINP